MPAQKPGKSEQVVCTPTVLLDAVKLRLNIHQFDWDLAADAINSVVPSQFYTEADNALIHPWSRAKRTGLKHSVQGWNWCNPPYANLAPWVQRGFEETVAHGAMTAMLVPASVGANWWAEWVDRCAHVLFLNGRVTFTGHTKPYPKDLALLLYSPIVFGGYEVFDWRK